MNQIESLIFLLGAAALLAQMARLLKVPYPVFLVLGGLVIGFVPWLPTVEISPDVIFVVFLPPLLNYAAFFSSPPDPRRHLRPILALAIGLVLVTTAAIAFITHVLVGLPWAVVFVLGAILAPTDPVAVEAIFRRLSVPGRVSTVVGGDDLWPLLLFTSYYLADLSQDSRKLGLRVCKDLSGSLTAEATELRDSRDSQP